MIRTIGGWRGFRARGAGGPGGGGRGGGEEVVVRSEPGWVLARLRNERFFFVGVFLAAWDIGVLGVVVERGVGPRGAAAGAGCYRGRGGVGGGVRASGRVALRGGWGGGPRV